MSDTTTCFDGSIEKHTHLVEVLCTLSEKHQFDFSVNTGLYFHLPKLPVMQRSKPQTALTVNCLSFNNDDVEALQTFCTNPFFYSVVYDQNMQRDRYFFGQKNIINWELFKSTLASKKFTIDSVILDKLKQTRSFFHHNLTIYPSFLDTYSVFPVSIENYALSKKQTKENEGEFMIYPVETFVEFYNQHIGEIKEAHSNQRKYNIFD